MNFILTPEFIYLIFSVQKDDNGNIVKVKFFIMNSHEIDYGNYLIATKEQVIDLILKNFTFKTYYKDEQNIGYIIGPQVHVFKDKYLRTDETDTEKDNLDNLPQF